MMQRTSLTLHGAAIVWVALALACAGSPSPRFYRLQALRDATPVANLGDVGIAVGPVNLPRYLDQPQIATRRSETRVEYGDLDRWAGGSLESETLRVLGQNLGVLLGTDRVVVYPLRGPFPVKYRVRLDVERFDGKRGEAVDLRVRWLIVSPESRDALAVEIDDLTAPVPSAKTRALVEAHGALLGELSRKIAERLAALEAADS